MKKLAYRTLLAIVAIFVIPSWIFVYLTDAWGEIWNESKETYRLGWIAFKKGGKLTTQEEWDKD